MSHAETPYVHVLYVLCIINSIQYYILSCVNVNSYGRQKIDKNIIYKRDSFTRYKKLLVSPSKYNK